MQPFLNFSKNGQKKFITAGYNYHRILKTNKINPYGLHKMEIIA